eukprot:scaffold326843_cov15-Prasinocladus_malaysianus.AAC.1
MVVCYRLRYLQHRHSYEYECRTVPYGVVASCELRPLRLYSYSYGTVAKQRRASADCHFGYVVRSTYYVPRTAV